MNSGPIVLKVIYSIVILLVAMGVVLLLGASGHRMNLNDFDMVRDFVVQPVASVLLAVTLCFSVRRKVWLLLRIFLLVLMQLLYVLNIIAALDEPYAEGYFIFGILFYFSLFGTNGYLLYKEVKSFCGLIK